MIKNNTFRDTIITAIIFMIILLVITNDYSEAALVKVASWQWFLFVPFYYIFSKLIAKNKAKKQ